MSPVIGLERFAYKQCSRRDADYRDKPGKLVLRRLAQHLAAVVDRPVLVAKDDIGQRLAFFHSDRDLVRQLSLDGDLLDIRQLREDAAQGGEPVKEKEQVVALLDVYGPDDLFIGIVCVSFDLYIRNSEKTLITKMTATITRKNIIGPLKLSSIFCRLMFSSVSALFLFGFILNAIVCPFPAAPYGVTRQCSR